MIENASVLIMMRLRQIVQELAKYSKSIHENYHITIPQLMCLQEVYERGPVSIGALTGWIFLNNSTVTGIVDRLEKRDLVRRKRISEDRRKIHVEITEEGAAFIQNAPTPLKKKFLDQLDGLEADQVDRLLGALGLLVDMLSPDGAEHGHRCSSGIETSEYKDGDENLYL